MALRLRLPFRRRLLRGHYKHGPNGSERDVNGISLREVGDANKVLEMCYGQLFVALTAKTQRQQDRDVDDLVQLYLVYMSMVGERVVQRTPTNWKDMTIDDLPMYTGTDYRFRTRSQIRKLFELLDIPETIGPRGVRRSFPGEYAFIFFLRRITSNKRVVDHIEVLGGEITSWGRVMCWLSRYIAGRWRGLLMDLPVALVERFPMYARAIARVANTVVDNRSGLYPQFDEDNFSVAAFVDCNHTQTPRPGSGPIGPGPGAPRRDNADDAQRAVYSGWTHNHGIKVSPRLPIILDPPCALLLFLFPRRPSF